MADIKIDKGVPIPSSGDKYPFKKMDIGDSFAVPEKEVNNLRVAMASINKENTGKFISRRGDNQIRVWRIS